MADSPPAVADASRNNRLGLAGLLVGALGIAFAPIFVRVSELVSLLVQPVLSAVFAWVLLGEAMGVQQGIAAVVVLAGIEIARRASAETRT